MYHLYTYCFQMQCRNYVISWNPAAETDWVVSHNYLVITSHSTHYRSFWRWSSQPTSWLVQKPSLPNRSLGWYNQTRSISN